MDNKRYEIVGKFISHGRRIVIAKLEHGTHVMPEEEWKWVLGKIRPKRRKSGLGVRRSRKSA